MNEELARADLWEIYIALNKRAGFYLNRAIGYSESKDYDEARIASLSYDRVIEAEKKIWARLEREI